MSYLMVAFIIGFILLLHEVGHFAAARAVRIPVERFSVGFGPKLWSFQAGGTEFCLALIPLGGYVLPKIENEDAFFRIPPGRRIVFALGGPLMNFISVLPLLGLVNVLTHGFSWGALLWQPIVQTANIFSQMLTGLSQVFSHPDQLTGVVGIISEGGRIASTGVTAVVLLTVFLSLNLALLNLLPIPALDGGQVMLTLLEKLSPKLRMIRVPAAILGWVLILSLMVYTTAKDVSGLL